MYEVEQKFRVPDRAAIEARLAALAAEWREPVEQIDRYFAHPCRDFARTDEALRLRRVGDDVAITWKGPRIDMATKTRREIELGLAEGPTLSGDERGGQGILDRWTGLLEALGFHRVRDLAKLRVGAHVLWQGMDVDVALDTVDGLGDFVELEILASVEGVPRATDCVASLASTLGCEVPERRSYLEMLLAAGG